MQKALRILLVEDSPDDALFLIRELKRGGFDPAFQRVHTLSALAAALDFGDLDLIISDHTLPGFDSLQALELVRQRSLDVPFIVVSGTIGEDMAVKAMKAGANDYVMKKQLARLVPSIERELAESSCRRIRREAEEALLRSEQELSDFFECAPVGLHWLGEDGTILRVNRAELCLLGYDREDMLGHSFSEFCTDIYAADELLQKLRRGEPLKEHETRLRCKNGDLKDVQIDSNVLLEDGKFVRARCFIRDITLHKQNQQAAAYLAAIVGSSEDAVIGTTLDGLISSWNIGAERMYGYTHAEVKGRPVSMLVPPFRLDEPPHLAARFIDGEGSGHHETLRLRKDGTRLAVSMTSSPIRDENGTVIGISTIERDMTARKEQEDERLKLIEEITAALANVKTLRGLLPICAWCKKIRDDDGFWEQIEAYVSQHTDAEFTHSLCPDCLERETAAVTTT